MKSAIEVTVYGERGKGRAASARTPAPGVVPAAREGRAGSPPTASPGVTQGGVEWGLSAPEYPEAARQRGEEGDVFLLVGFNGQGRAVSAQLERTSGFPLLDQAALGAVRSQLAEGAAAASTKVIKIQFKLK